MSDVIEFGVSVGFFVLVVFVSLGVWMIRARRRDAEQVKKVERGDFREALDDERFEE